jgi:glycosyltransferase involved in cell wall biosynthesis
VYGKKCFNFKPEAIRIFNYNLTWKIVNYLACKYADAIIAISNSVKNSFLCKRKVVVIYNEIIKESKANECISSRDNDVFKSFIEKSRNKFVLGFIGSICELKGFRDVVNSLIVLKQKGCIEKMILCVIGRFVNQKFKTNILRTISENHLSSHILFIGENFNPFPYIHHFNILLHLSKKEAFGLVILEAFSEGVPVISYNYGGPAEIIQHGKNGFTIDIGDVNKIADSITYLLKNSDVYNTMRTEAQERFQYFKSYSTFERIKKIFEAHCE